MVCHMVCHMVILIWTIVFMTKKYEEKNLKCPLIANRTFKQTS